MYTKEQLTNIFNRIGLVYDASAPCDLALMAAVQWGFQQNIPYENLDILRSVPLSLDYGDLYEKIVVNGRGGYCFELNGFLGEVYRSLGYEVTEYMARYLRGETEVPMRRHRVLRVTGTEGIPMICDAGIGQSAFRLPLEMREGFIGEQFGEVYKVEKEPFFGWVISDLHKGEWRRFYAFTEEEQLNIDYIMPSFWCEHAAQSPFTSAEMFSIKTETGRMTLDGNVFRIFDGETVTERSLDESEMPDIYRDVFGLPYCSEWKQEGVR
ncbi:MAG: arylamine N-acetyltransferase [Clostridia bacterium]|nr:arylamine N-acetyltransferase [Clostridia bacterium]